MRFSFQSRNMYSMVNGTLKKSSLTNPTEHILWEKKDKQAIVAILGTLDSFHKQEVINCSTSHTMWTHLRAYHNQHFEKCIIGLQAKYYIYKLNEGKSITVFISSLQQLATQLTNLGQAITEQQLISKIICSLPSSFDMLLYAWNNVPLGNHTLLGLQSRLIKLQNKLGDHAQQLEVPNDKAFFTKGAPSDTFPSHSSPTIEQKKERAEKFARHKRHARYYQCGKHCHFGKDCPNDTHSSSATNSEHKHTTRSSWHRQHKHSHMGKKSHAHVTTSFIKSSTSESSSISNEAYCVVFSSRESSSSNADSFRFADFGAREHMIDKLPWFTNFLSIDDHC